MGSEKLLMAYPCMIMQMLLAVGVQELPGIDKMFEATNTTNLGLIRNIANPLARKEIKGAVMLKDMYLHSGQTETVEAAEIGGQTETTQTLDIMGIPSAPPPVQSVPPRL